MGYLLDIRARKLGYDSYEQYLASEHWLNLRRGFQSRVPKRCYVCGTSKGVHLHHKRYENLGSEQDGDLVWVCWDHHDKLHKLVQHKTARLTDAHKHLRKLERGTPPRRHGKRREKGAEQAGTERRLSRYERMLVECAEILEWHGVVIEDFKIRSKRQLHRSLWFMHSVLCAGRIEWEDDKLKIEAPFKGELISVFLDVDRIHDVEYWIERRESAVLLIAARKKRKRMEARERDILAAKREDRRLS